MATQVIIKEVNKVMISRAFLAFCLFFGTSFASVVTETDKKWMTINIDKIQIKGGTSSDWVSIWLKKSIESGATNLGFKGVQYTHPCILKDMNDAAIEVENIPILKALELICLACGFEYRTVGDQILIQPSKTYSSMIIDLSDDFIEGIGIKNEKLGKKLLVKKLSKLGVKIDSSSDSIEFVKNQVIVQVIDIDKVTLESIVNLTKRGLHVNNPSK